MRSRLQWAGHVERMAEDRLPKRAAELREQGRRRRGRPRLRWEDCVKRDVRKAGEEEDWKKKTRDRQRRVETTIRWSGEKVAGSTSPLTKGNEEQRGVTTSLLIRLFNVSPPSWNMPCSLNDTSMSSFSILPFVHSLCAYSSSSSSVVSLSIAVVWEAMTVHIVYDNVHLLSADATLVIPSRPALFFPIAFSHSVLWSAETWLKRRSVRFTTMLPSLNSWRTSGGRTDISARYTVPHPA